MLVTDPTGPRLRPDWRRAATVVAAIAPAVLLALVVVARRAPVLARGDLLGSFEDYEDVSLVRLWGLELYVDTSSGTADLLTVATLALMAALLATGAVALWRRAGPSRVVRAFAAGALLSAYLAGDDLLGAHETLGHNVPALAALPLIDHPDDAIVGLYAAGLATFAWWHRDLARGTPRWPWVLTAVLGTAAVTHDLLPLHLSAVEEACEVAAGLALLVAVFGIVGQHLRENRRGPVDPGA